MLSLPRGKGRAFQERMVALAGYIQEELVPALSTDAMKARRKELEGEARVEIEAKSKAFDAQLKEAGLGLVNVRNGENSSTAIVPLVDGKPAPPEAYEQLVADGKVPEQEVERVKAALKSFSESFAKLNGELNEHQGAAREKVRELYESEARRLLSIQLREIESSYPSECVHSFLTEVVDDVVGSRLASLEEGSVSAKDLYAVNVLASHEGEGCPVIVESTPTMQNLLGGIDRVVLPNGSSSSDHTMISAGSLLRAEGGFLILDARDLINESGAWKVLVRTLRTGQLEIVPHDLGVFGRAGNLKPEPIDVNVKVILIGDPGLYYALDAQDPDFPNLFKVLADFDTEIERNKTSLGYYAGVISGMAERENLPPFEASAIAALAEHGARIAGRNDRLTVRYGRLGDIAREAAFLTTHHDSSEPNVTGDHVREAVVRSRKRADRPSRRFRSNIAEGTIRIETKGTCIGQVNGLAVMSAGPLTFGFPARITASAGAGGKGVVNIEREARLSGRIHTKGSHILDGLLRHLLPTSHPLAFSISIAFEQSYGGVDGDSASGIETCCVLSALTGVPIRQSLAMTGAIDQFGHIQPIGGASEKIEGFFDACSDMGLTGDQGVILPKANLRNLMLRADVVEACDQGRFHVFGVETIHEALELFTGIPAGELDDQGQYPEGTLLAQAVERAGEYWSRVSGRSLPLGDEDGDGKGSGRDGEVPVEA